MKNSFLIFLALFLQVILFKNFTSPINAAPLPPPPDPGAYYCTWIGIGPLGTCRVGATTCSECYRAPASNDCDGRSYDNCTDPPNPSCQIDPTCIPSGGGGGSTPVSTGPPIEGCGIQTAIGCIPIQNENDLALFFLRWGMGLGGGIALILMVVSTFMIMTSAGDPRKLQAGKELLTSAITGLVMLVFSAYILNFIGVKILDIF